MAGRFNRERSRITSSAEERKYVVDLSLGAPTPAFAVMNKDIYNKLPADLKAVIDKSCAFGKQGTIDLWVQAWEDAKKYFKAEGVEIVCLSPQEQARWVSIIDRARDRVGAELDAKGIPGTEIVKYIRERVE